MIGPRLAGAATTHGGTMRRLLPSTLAVGLGLAALLSSGLTAPAQAEGRGDIRITRTVVNHAQPVVVGPRTPTTFPVRFRITDDSGLRRMTRFSTFNTDTGRGYADVESRSCRSVDPTTSVCTLQALIDPVGLAGYSTANANADAGEWTVNATVEANDGDYWIADYLTRYRVLRQTGLSVGAATADAGRAVTLRGRLTHANWEQHTWSGYGRQSVQLRYRPAGATRFTTVRTVTASRRGYLAATVRATAKGQYRWRFLGDGRNAPSVSDVLRLS